jgi:hypothetical protein
MQGTLATVAALAAGGTLLLSRQLRARRPAVTVQAFEAVQEQLRSRPGRLGTIAALALGGYFLAQRMKKRHGIDTLSSVEDVIEVDVPISTAYNQWTQFEDFPKFMGSVQEVRQIDDTHVHWCATVAGKTKEWDAEITEQIPDRRIAWQTTMLGGLVGGRIWRYELEPAEGGAAGAATSSPRTLVRETWDISRDKQALILKKTGMPKQAEQGMRATLERIAGLVEKG